MKYRESIQFPPGREGQVAHNLQNQEGTNKNNNL